MNLKGTSSNIKNVQQKDNNKNFLQIYYTISLLTNVHKYNFHKFNSFLCSLSPCWQPQKIHRTDESQFANLSAEFGLHHISYPEALEFLQRSAQERWFDARWFVRKQLRFAVARREARRVDVRVVFLKLFIRDLKQPSAVCLVLCVLGNACSLSFAQGQWHNAENDTPCFPKRVGIYQFWSEKNFYFQFRVTDCTPIKLLRKEVATLKHSRINWKNRENRNLWGARLFIRRPPAWVASSCPADSFCGRGWCSPADPAGRAATNSASASRTVLN